MAHTQETRDKISSIMKQRSENKPFRIKDRKLNKYVSLNITRKELEDYKLVQVVCEICGKPDDILGRRLSVDHCHDTNTFRGLLCTKCNMNFDWFLANTSAIVAYSNKVRE